MRLGPQIGVHQVVAEVVAEKRWAGAGACACTRATGRSAASITSAVAACSVDPTRAAVLALAGQGAGHPAGRVAQHRAGVVRDPCAFDRLRWRQRDVRGWLGRIAFGCARGEAAEWARALKTGWLSPAWCRRAQQGCYRDGECGDESHGLPPSTPSVAHMPVVALRLCVSIRPIESIIPDNS